MYNIAGTAEPVVNGQKFELVFLYKSRAALPQLLFGLEKNAHHTL